MASWKINEDKSIINISLDVESEPYRLDLIIEHNPPASEGRTLRVYDRHDEEVTMLDDRRLPVLEEGLAVVVNDMTDIELPHPERFHWQSLLDFAVRSQRRFDQFSERAWFVTATEETTLQGVITVPGNHDLQIHVVIEERPSRISAFASRILLGKSGLIMLADLQEEYHLRTTSEGKLASTWWFAKQVLKSIATRLFA